jgi:hypothetical protein
MGRILSFVPQQAANRRSPRAADAPASVIIFPGVRYERPPGDKSRDGAEKNAAPLAAPSPRR